MTSIHINFVTLLLLVVLFACISSQDIGTIPAPIPNTLQVFALPVGQGDCTVIQCPNGNIVFVDCGTSGGNRLTAYGVEKWLNTSISNVYYILITHPDRDHHSYLPDIFTDITNIIGVIIGGSLDDYQGENIYNWLNNLRTQVPSKLFTISNGQSCINNCALGIGTNFCNNGNYQFNILAANVGPSSNEESIVMRINTSGGWSMLLSGDMEDDASLEIANELGAGLQSVVYKMSHHGASRLANKVEWLTPIAPTYAFASSAYDFGNCKHPRCNTIIRLQNLPSMTITAQPHQFYCTNDTTGIPMTDNNYRYHMVETAPNPDDICFLAYISNVNADPTVNCIRVTTQYSRLRVLANETDVVAAASADEECDDYTTANGGALCMVTNSLILAATLILSFINSN